MSKHKLLMLAGISLVTAGLGWMYAPLALVFLGVVALIEVLTSTGGAT